jgi:hypothetical protein
MSIVSTSPSGQDPAVRDLLAELDAAELRLLALSAAAVDAETLARSLEGIRLERSLLLR